MTETVVHVTTIEEWKSVLDVLFKQGYFWVNGDKGYKEQLFERSGRYLCLDDVITYSKYNLSSKPFIEYSEFISQQKEDNKMAKVYVTQKQYDLIEELKSRTYPIDFLILKSDGYFEPLTKELTPDEAKALLRYLGGDETIEFKVKEQLYRLWRINDSDNKVYMRFNLGTPDWTLYEERAFTAPLEEIKKWKTPAWQIEKAI